MFTVKKYDYSNLPYKTVMALFWFALFGAVSFYVNIEYFGLKTNFSAHNTSSSIGALKNTGSLDSTVFESDADLFNHMKYIVNPRQPLEYSDGSAMVHFVEDLQKLNIGTLSHPLRILHYGDSILTTDELSGRVRGILQNRFGDGGHGFVLLLRPWSWYHHIGVEQGGVTDKWKIHPFTSSPLPDGFYGLGGVAFIANRKGSAKAWVSTADEGLQGREVSSFDISYLQHSTGGTFDVLIDDQFREKVDTRGDEKKIMHRKVDVELGKSKLMIKTNSDGIVRLFGVILENGQSGVVYDSLSVNGASGTNLARMDGGMWQKEITYREPSLVIIMMGANEGANKSLNLQEYKRDFSAVLDTVTSSSKTASCLVVGPLDQAKIAEAGGLESKKMPVKLSVAQKEVAFAHGCAFFDTFSAMGGTGSMAKWCVSGLGGGDFIHPTQAGARKIGNWLAEALIYEYQRYGNKKVKR
ncbi:MAG: hypothetical protein JXR91_10250 [Deltaproteobacteria bacterium]|nr:hypothetical protein [Deltaproteobacteria bacterium]